MLACPRLEAYKRLFSYLKYTSRPGVDKVLTLKPACTDACCFTAGCDLRALLHVQPRIFLCGRLIVRL